MCTNARHEIDRLQDIIRRAKKAMSDGIGFDGKCHGIDTLDQQNVYDILSELDNPRS